MRDDYTAFPKKVRITEWTAAWAVGRNMVGYSPDPDNVAYFRTWEEARESLEAEMRDWASEEDESWLDYAEEVLEREGLALAAASVEAYVGAIFAVDGHHFRSDQPDAIYVDDARGVTWAWWIEPVDESDVDEYAWDEED